MTDEISIFTSADEILIPTDPVDFMLDEDGDLVVDTTIHFVTGLDAVCQSLRYRLKLFLGEMFTDRNVGVPYHQELLWQKFDQQKALLIFRDKILATPNVLSVLSATVEFDSTSRKVSLNFEANTVFGNTGIIAVEQEI